MPPRECAVAGCGLRVYARSLCRSHYERRRLYGDPLASAPDTRPWRGQPCRVEGCDRPNRARGLCTLHVQRAYAHDGDPLGGHYRSPQLCAVPDCERVSRASGLCQPHYIRQRNGQVLDAPLEPRSRSHRRALRELAERLEVLGVVEDQSHARGFVAFLAAYWPATDLFEDGEWMEVVGPVGDPSMFGL
jgi:hypothetical protein